MTPGDAVLVDVVLVDDHELIRRGLREAFTTDGGFRVVGEAGTVAEIRQQVRESRPHVVVLDVHLPDGSGLGTARDLRAEHPDLGIVVLTMSDTDEHLLGALEIGASAFVLKSAPVAAVLAAAHQAAAAPLTFSAGDLAGALQRRLSAHVPALSDREQAVLLLLSEGLTLAAIAQRLFLSASSAKADTAKLYQKLQATNRSQAMVEAVRLGLLTVQVGGERTTPITKR